PIACPLCGVGPALAVALEQHWSEMASLLGEPPYVPALSHGPCFQAFCALELTDAGVGILPRTPAPAGISLSPRAPAGRKKRTPGRPIGTGSARPHHRPSLLITWMPLVGVSGLVGGVIGGGRGE